MEYVPYTYLIGWTELDKWYYGVEYGLKKKPTANPANLWTAYFTSSSVVTYLRSKFGEPDVVSVRKIFPSGTSEERMEQSINWEKKVLSRIDITQEKWINGRMGGDICPATSKKICMLRYGVENVFQAVEIKEKIKKTNLRLYGVEHPSHSKKLLERKAKNNIEKFGVSCPLQLPGVREKANAAIRDPKVREKVKKNNLLRFGVEHTGQRSDVREKVKNTRSKLSDRINVKMIREYNRIYDIKINEGWYQSPDEKINEILHDLHQKYGKHTLEELQTIQRTKKYSSSIKKLQERKEVQKIKQYKEKFGKKIKLGRSWDRKTDEQLMGILDNLEQEWGSI